MPPSMQVGLMCIRLQPVGAPPCCWHDPETGVRLRQIGVNLQGPAGEIMGSVEGSGS